MLPNCKGFLARRLVGGGSQRLSGGEQQRLAIARAILDRPDWLFLDEATSALDEKLEAEIYRILRQVLPNTTIVSIGHRSTLVKLHRRHIEMEPGQDGIFEPTQKLPATAALLAEGDASEPMVPRPW